MTIKLSEALAGVKSLEGSYEDLRDDLSRQLRPSYGEPGWSDSYMCIVATFPSYVIVRECDWSMDDDLYWKAPYTMKGIEPVINVMKTDWEALEIDYVPLGTGNYSDIDDDDDTFETDGDASTETATGPMGAGKAKLDSGAGSKKRSSLKDSDFAYVEPGHKVGGSTPDQYRHFPIHDKAHVRNALARLGQSKWGPKAKAKVMSAAKRFGVKAESASSASKVMELDLAAVMKAARSDEQPGFFEKVKKLLTSLRSAHESNSDFKAFNVTKDATGRMRFFCYPSNNYEDREKELFTAEAHKAAIDWYFKEKSFPELWVWHTKDTKFGQVDWMDFVDGMVVASGFIDADKEAVAERLASQDTAMSHGFLGVKEKEADSSGVKSWTLYLDYELSALPRHAVANYGTAFNLEQAIKEGELSMPFTPERKAYLKDTLKVDDATLTNMEKSADATAAGMRALGLSSKSLGVADPEPAPAPNPAPEGPKPDDAITAGLKAIMAEQQAAMEQLVAKATAAEQRAIAAEAKVLGVVANTEPRMAGAARFEASTDPASRVNANSKEVREANKVFDGDDISFFARAMGVQGAGVINSITPAVGGFPGGLGVRTGGPAGLSEADAAAMAGAPTA